MIRGNIRNLAMVAASVLAVVARSEVEVSRFTIDGGGAMRSTSGVLELSGTIGQPDAGVLSGGACKLTGGFWFETPTGDCNSDGIVGLLDHEAFVDCLSGPINGIEARCECFDVNRSGTIDLADYSENQRSFFSE